MHDVVTVPLHALVQCIFLVSTVNCVDVAQNVILTPLYNLFLAENLFSIRSIAQKIVLLPTY